MSPTEIAPAIESPDAAAARLKCDAPRVSLADLEANIVHTEYVKHIAPSGQVLRWCVLTVRNGHAVTGDPSAAVSAANDRAELGEKYARENAIRELWKVMGYELKQRLHMAPPPSKVVLTWADLKTLNSQELHKFGYRYDAMTTEYVHVDGTRVRGI